MSKTAADRIGEIQYEESGEFPVERGYIWTSCASVENGNPLFWDDDVAAEITDGPIAPPSMISVWFRPHHWAPGRTEQALPLQRQLARELCERRDFQFGRSCGDERQQPDDHGHEQHHS